MDRLKKALDELKVEYTQETIDKFTMYMDEILEWNEKINLTAITDRDEFISKHFIDSLLAAAAAGMSEARNIIDVGTGGGFPGMPLAIIFPDKHFVLMDSLNKRLKVIDAACGKIGITNVTTLHGRAEELSRNKEHREKYDVCVSRAVANMSTLSEYCLPFVKKGGYFLAYKGPNSEEEVAAAANAIKLLGGKIEGYTEAMFSGFEFSHHIICVKKIKETPAKYPRKAGIPSKEPLK